MLSKKRLIRTCLTLAGLLICAGCMAAAPAETVTHTETAAPMKDVTTPAQPDPTQTPASAESSPEETAAVPSPTVTPQDTVEDTCVRCHSDQQMLIDTAFPEDILVSENEGEG